LKNELFVLLLTQYFLPLKRILFILIFCSFFAGVLRAQEYDSTNIQLGIIDETDTIIHRNIDEVIVLPQRKYKNKRQMRRYSRLVQRIKKVYPLAVEARVLLAKYEPEYNMLKNKRDRRKLMKQLEKELLSKHKKEMKKWSLTDGRILLKLINRETTRTPYSLIKDFRGSFSAVFWQGIARIFRNNLKAGYDPEEEDWMIEEIVSLIEIGYL
jgi:hypothetical protein